MMHFRMPDVDNFCFALVSCLFFFHIRSIFSLPRNGRKPSSFPRSFAAGMILLMIEMQHPRVEVGSFYPFI